MRAALAALALACAGAAAWATPAEPGAETRARFALEQGLFPAPAWNPAAPAQAAQAALAAGQDIAHRVRDQAGELVLTAMNFLGVRYRRGGADAEAGFDCSGFTRHIVESVLGHVLPRRADEQARAAGLVAVRREELRPGDLVFFNTLRRTFSHVGIYVGDGRFIHAPRPGGEVRVEAMGLDYWRRRFTGARRLETLAAAPAEATAAPVPGPATALGTAPALGPPAATAAPAVPGGAPHPATASRPDPTPPPAAPF